MAGHNKWSKIKHKKAGTDAQKSRIFGKMAKLLTAESKRCGGNRNDPGLKAAIERAKAVNMPSQNIDRAVERGSSQNADNLQKITYEMYGPGGCAVLIHTLTDNRNRTTAEIRHIITKNGFTIGEQGSASWIFIKQGNTTTPTTTVTLSDEDTGSLERLLNELNEQEDTQEIHTNKA